MAQDENAASGVDAPPPAAEPAAEPVPAPVEIETVGRKLRAAREALRLSVEDVAQTLKFSPRQIELIEADNYAALPGTTIVRGFTRSYARLLKLDAEALLHLLDDRTPSLPTDVRPPDNMGIADDTAAPQQFSLLASAAIVIALVAVLLGVWHFLGPSVKTSVGANGERQAAGFPSASPPQVAAIAVPAAPADTAPPVAGSTAADQPAAAAAPVLTFVFTGRSWLEVSDAKKQVLHSGENPAGSELSLAGQPPFDIVVGNAAKVRLTFGDRVIDLAPHTRAEVARLKVE